jgi:DNA-binding response OmpR family regulator
MSLKIMVASEESKFAQLVRSLATPMGHMVLPFTDYQAAGQRGDTQRFDIAFVGMGSPAAAGLKLANRLRSSQPNRDAIIVMLNDRDDIPSLRNAFGQGADLVLTTPVTADHLRRMLAAMDQRDWKDRRHAARLPLFTEVACTWHNQEFQLHSMNISESGMLLQPAIEAEAGEEVALDFKIVEVKASLTVKARVIRKEGTERVGMEFVGLRPEDRNSIQLYVTGHLERLEPRAAASFAPRRMFHP